MATLKEAPAKGRVLGVFAKPADQPGIESQSLSEAHLTFAGLMEDAHAGLTRPACVRTKALYREGETIRNTRQLSLVSREELEEIAQTLEIPAVAPEWLGANLLIEGVAQLTLLPPSTRLIFSSGASLVVDLLNAPCAFPAKVIERHHPQKGRHFVGASRERRGVTAWVEKEGSLAPGDLVRIFLPTQRAYPAYGE